MAEPEELKLYFDYKSPFAYLGVEPAFELPDRFAVGLRWIPFTLRIKGRGERSQYSEWKARYSYMDARRWANRRGGFRIKGPPKVYDSSPALIGGLFAQAQGVGQEWSQYAVGVLRIGSKWIDRHLPIHVHQPDSLANRPKESAKQKASSSDQEGLDDGPVHWCV